MTTQDSPGAFHERRPNLPHSSLPHSSPPYSSPLHPSPLRRSTVWISRPKRTLFLVQASDPFSNFRLEALGRYMESAGFQPDLVVIGGGGAAQSTWSALEPSFSLPARIWMEPQFDDGRFEERLEILRAAPADAEQILLIAQGTTVRELAAALARGYAPTRARIARHAMLRDFPDGALAVVSLSINRWSALAPKMGLMKAFVRPDDLCRQDW